MQVAWLVLCVVIFIYDLKVSLKADVPEWKASSEDGVRRKWMSDLHERHRFWRVFNRFSSRGWPSPSPYYLLHTTYYLLFTPYYSLHTTHYLLFTTHYSLLTTHYLLLASYYLLLTTDY